jgi:hypothetical protein
MTGFADDMKEQGQMVEPPPPGAVNAERGCTVANVAIQRGARFRSVRHDNSGL